MAFSKIAAENLGGSTLPALAAGSLTGITTGAMVLVETKTISSGASTVDFTSGISSTYKMYMWHIINVDVSANSNLQIQYSTDGGSSYVSGGDKYDYAVRMYNSNNSFGTNPSVEDTKMDLTVGGSQLDDSDAHNCTMTIYMSAHSDNTTRTNLHWHLGLCGTDNGYATAGYGAGGFRSTSHIPNAIRFKLSSGTFDSGHISMYGIAT
tara:strand:+ start:199 stop:822 length:624 start_codon:yes stop_codon:yes gene_type:complete